MRKVSIKVEDITKIKECDDCVIFYTEKQCWVCEKHQEKPSKNDIFIELALKVKGGEK